MGGFSLAPPRVLPKVESRRFKQQSAVEMGCQPDSANLRSTAAKAIFKQIFGED
jgi:hypothetical protein